MNLYLETSAFGRILLGEPGWQIARAALAAAAVVSTSRVSYVEAHALIASARRAGRLTAAASRRARSDIDELWWPELDVIELSESVAERAAEAAARHRLRPLDAIHFGSFEVLGPEFVIATWDDRLRGAVRAAGRALIPA